MARQIFILETRKAGDGTTQVSGFNWYPVVGAAAKVPRLSFVSAGASIPTPNNILPAEQTALEDGSAREEPFSIAYAASTTKVTIQADLVRRWVDRKATIDAEPATRQFYGVFYDGTAWSA